MKTPFPSELWRPRYEALRQHVLNGHDLLATPPLGLHLLRQHGVAGWMAQWAEALEPSDLGVRSPPPPWLLCPADWQEQLTVLLAQMTFQRIHVARTP
jgi:hypothetical protein